MTLSVEVKPALEDSLKRTALREGVTVEEFIQRLLEQRLPEDRTRLSEIALLERINQSDTGGLRAQIGNLWEKRERKSFSAMEIDRLTELQEALNTTNADLWADIAELARRKGETLAEMAKKLGIATAEVL